MAKKVVAEVKLQIPAGAANPSPPVVATLVEQLDGHRQHRGEVVAGPTAAPPFRLAHETGPGWSPSWCPGW